MDIFKKEDFEMGDVMEDSDGSLLQRRGIILHACKIEFGITCISLIDKTYRPAEFISSSRGRWLGFQRRFWQRSYLTRL